MVVGISGIMTCITEIGGKITTHPRTLDVRGCKKNQKKCIFIGKVPLIGPLRWQICLEGMPVRVLREPNQICGAP